MSQIRPLSPSDLIAAPHSRPAAPRASLSRRIVQGLAEAVAIVRRARTERETARALARLGDRQLKDIGVDRAAIPQVARAAAWAQLTAAGLDRLESRPWPREF